jgi:hypothetical protein
MNDKTVYFTAIQSKLPEGTYDFIPCQLYKQQLLFIKSLWWQAAFRISLAKVGANSN